MSSTASPVQFFNIEKLMRVSTQSLDKYEEIFSHITEKYKDNYDEALNEIAKLKQEGVDFFNEQIDALLVASKGSTPRPQSELIEVLRKNDSNSSELSQGMYQAAFYSAIDCPNQAKKKHLENILHDNEIIFSQMKQKIILKQELHKKAKLNGASGGKVFSDKSEDAVFLVLDIWRRDYQHLSNKKASRILVELANKKIDELNNIISTSRDTNLTVMPTITDSDTVATWISTLKNIINGKPLPKKHRVCIRNYHDNYYLKNKYFY